MGFARVTKVIVGFIFNGICAYIPIGRGIRLKPVSVWVRIPVGAFVKDSVLVLCFSIALGKLKVGSNQTEVEMCATSNPSLGRQTVRFRNLSYYKRQTD